MRSFLIGGNLTLQGKAREWIQILEIGTFKGYREGRQPIEITRKLVEDVITNFNRRRNPVVVDYEHQTISPMQAPAAGWIKQLELRDKGLWAKVDWTPRAKALVEGGEYLFTSVVIFFESKDRRSGEELGPMLHSVGLTNDPFIDGLEPVVARFAASFFNSLEEEHPVNFFEAVKAELGIKEATEEQLLTAIKGGAAALTFQQAEFPKVGQALGLQPDADMATMVATALAYRAKASKADEGPSQEALRLQAQRERLEAERLVASFPAKVTPAMREQCIGMAIKDAGGFKAFMASMPDVLPIGEAIASKAAEGGTYTNAELAVFRQIGVSPEDVKKLVG